MERFQTENAREKPHDPINGTVSSKNIHIQLNALVVLVCYPEKIYTFSLDFSHSDLFFSQNYVYIINYLSKPA